jgi:hypothetical protein
LGSGACRFDRHLLSLFIGGALLFLSSVSVAAQSEKPIPQSKPSVLIAALPVEGPRDEGVRKVLASAMRFQLERIGMQTILFSTTDEESLVRDLLGDEQADPRVLATSLIEFVSGLRHDFLALAGYTREGGEIQVSFYIADLQRGEILASASQRVRIDFTLDEAMIGALEQMLPRAEGRIEEVARRKAAEAAELAETRPEEAEETVREPATEEGTTPETTRLPRELPAPEVEREERFRPFEFSIGFAPFVPVGVANQVFGLSYAPFVYGNYRIPLSAGVLGLGVSTGLNIFDAEETGIAEYFHYIVPLGFDVRYTTAGDSRLGLFVRADVGAGINVSDFSSLPAEAQKGLSRFLAYGSGGVGAMFAFLPSVGIAIDVMYETFVYFYKEESGGGIKTDWIMGFVPSVYLYTRL